MKGIDRSFSSTPAMLVGPGHCGLISAASMAPIECHGVQPGFCKRDQDQRSSHEAASVNDNAFIMEVQDYTEDKRVTMKQGGAPSEHPEVVEPSSRPLRGSSASLSDPSVDDERLILCSVSISGTERCESEQGPFFLASQQVSSLLEAKMQRYHTFNTSGAPSTPPRVHSLASAASHNALEAVFVSLPSVSKGAPSFALESPSERKGSSLQALPSDLSRVEAQHNQQAGQAQQRLDPGAQTLHNQQEQLQGVSSPILAANDGLHSSSLQFTSGATVLETPPNLEYRKPVLGGGI